MATYDPQQHSRKVICLEIFFPLLYNPKPGDRPSERKRIPAKYHRQTFKEIEEHFRGRIDGWSFEYRRDPTYGTWMGTEDDIIRFFIDGVFTAEDFAWIWKMKHEVWQKRFEQEIIYCKYSEATEIL